MVSWASVAGKEASEPPPDKQPSVAVTDVQHTSTAVVDANAIIQGMSLERLADQALTIPEVLQEIRDQRSREYLQNFPHGIKAVQPAKESIDAGNITDENISRAIANQLAALQWSAILGVWSASVM